MLSAQQYTQFDRLLKSNHIRQLVQNGFELLQAPILVADSSFRVLAHAGFSEESPLGRAFAPLLEGGLPVHVFSCPEPGRAPPGAGERYRLALSELEKPVHFIRMTLSLSTRTVGYLCVFLEEADEGRIPWEVLSWLERFSLILLVKDHPNGVFGSPIQFFFSSLISAPRENQNHDLINEQRERLHINLEHHIYILTAHTQASEFASAIPIQTLLEEVNRAIPGVYPFLYKDNLTAVFSLPMVSTALHETLAPLVPILRRYALCCGVSANIGSLTQMSVAYNQAVKAQELGVRLNRGAPYYLYEDYMHYHMMELLERDQDLLQFCHPVIRGLMYHDSAFGTSHLQTLYVYLTSRNSVSRTAEALCIHQNTVKYRISQITRIIGFDLQDGNENFPLFLSLKILRFLGKL